jgi:lipopolysaccharide export system protein LptA
MLTGFKLAAALQVLAGLTLLFFSAAAPAAAPGGLKGDVTKINADSMAYDSAKRLVSFRKKVRVVQPDFTLTSDSLDVYLSGNGGRDGRNGGSRGLAPGMEGGRVEKIIARDNVVIRLPDGRTATCQKATYTVYDEVLLMEGNPVLREEGNVLSADVIRFYLAENRSTAQGNVKVDFTSKSDGKNADGQAAPQ